MSFFQQLSLLRVTHDGEGGASLSGLVTDRTLLHLTVSREARECFTPAFPPPRRQTPESGSGLQVPAVPQDNCPRARLGSVAYKSRDRGQAAWPCVPRSPQVHIPRA